LTGLTHIASHNDILSTSGLSWKFRTQYKTYRIVNLGTKQVNSDQYHFTISQFCKLLHITVWQCLYFISPSVDMNQLCCDVTYFSSI